MNNFTNFLVLICCTILCSGYDLFRCPVPSEWRFRSEYICRNTSKPHYYCMIDGNNNDIYKEFCRNKNDFEGAGRQFVFKGINPDGQDCFDDRYQPILFWTNGSSECIFQKSKCQGDGLFVLSNGTTSTDITCRCDHKQGYAFVSKPENPCFCVPSQEDCSCYRKHCKSTEKLSPNYTCIPYGEQPTTLCHASHESGFVEIQRPTLKNVSDTKNNLVSFKMGHNKSRYDAKTAVLILSVIFVIIGVIGFLFILCGAPHLDCVKMAYDAIEGHAVQMEFCVVSFLQVEIEIVTANGVSHHINPTRVDGKKKYCSFAVENPQKSDSGIFICYASNKFGTEKLKKELHVKASPKLVLHVHECVQPDGMEDDVMLECEVQSDNIAIESIIWRKHVGETVTDIEAGNNSDKYTVGTPDMPSLTIHHVDNNDKGSYVCEVTHMFGTTESEPIVLGPPVITEDILYQENLKRMKLVCVVRSNTKIYSAKWTHRTSSGVVDISPNPSIGKYTGSTVEDPSLTILKPDSDDAGIYTCIVSNKIGTSQSASLVVGRPEVTVDKLSYYAEVGNSITINCKVSSSLPLTKITWERKTSDEETVVDLNDKAKFLGATSDNLSLTILNVDSSDMGQYICFAANPVGTVESPKITVTDVKALPKIEIEDESFYAEVGNKVEIKCKVNSNLPITKVTWKRKISDNMTEWVELSDCKKFLGTTPDNPSLIISNVESCDFGSYTCCVTNSVGTVESSTILLSEVEGNRKSQRTEPEENINSEWRDLDVCSPRVFKGKSMKGSIKERSEKSTDETDHGKHLQFAQVVLTNADAEKARRKAQQLLEEELRIVFVGKTGVGKSSTANTILGENYFPFGSSFNAVTKKCLFATTKYKSKSVKLIDTPGIFASSDNEKETEEEIKRCIFLAAPGPHVILFVIEYGRFKKEDIKCIDTFLEYFGEDLKKFVIVVFTHVDNMAETETIKGMLDEVPELNDFIAECDHRYCKFNNKGKGKEKEDQIGHLFEMISTFKTINDLKYFTDESILSAEEMVRKREKELESSIREQCERIHSQKIKELQEKINITEATEEIRIITQQFEQKHEELRKECERQIELAREKARKEFEVQKFSKFQMKRNKQRRFQSL